MGYPFNYKWSHFLFKVNSERSEMDAFFLKGVELGAYLYAIFNLNSLMLLKTYKFQQCF